MAIRINERWKFGQRTIELFGKAQGRYAKIMWDIEGNLSESGSKALIRAFARRQLNYTSRSDYFLKRHWLKLRKGKEEFY
ncbi:hypothetical protein HYU13_00175 [Candidatus Woesearchaeota archaeon]|nr:hypothetical protein [Candidatus Woesearchaeota archaeon]